MSKPRSSDKAKRHTDYSSFFATPRGGEGDRCHYPTRLDSYGCGCSHDCAYCYARSLLDFRGLWDPKSPSVADVQDISKALRKVEAGSVVRLGGMTDCFQPIERRYRATYQLIKMLNARRIGYLIVTKSDLIAEPMYLRVMDPELAHIQVTVTSTSDEPNFLQEKATPPSKRIEAAQKLDEAGFDVSLRVSPYIPELVDTTALSESGIGKCLVEFLRVNHWIEKWTGREWPEHTLREGGYRHLELADKLELLEEFDFPEMSVCEDVQEHYEFFKSQYNYNPEDCCNLKGVL